MFEQVSGSASPPLPPSTNPLNTPLPLPLPPPPSRYCDLTAVPRKSELKILALYARDKVDRDALLRMSSKEGKDEYKEKIEGMHVGLSRLITEFVPSVRMTLPQFIAFCPRMVPRCVRACERASFPCFQNI